MLINLAAIKSVAVDEVGGKAFNLHKLMRMQLPVPPTGVIPAHITMSEQLWEVVSDNELIAEGNKFAVRSSGIGEDGIQSSYAGIFETVLNVQTEELLAAINQVKASTDGVRSEMYKRERNTRIEGMGVIIQHMVEADYAGVAFTYSPVDKDHRIALIEVVSGNGESLVSGKKTPAAIRVNKITHMNRVTRNGVDNIPDNELENIAEMLMPFINIIEDNYGLPMDVEWAIADDQVYILQARPITA